MRPYVRSLLTFAAVAALMAAGVSGSGAATPRDAAAADNLELQLTPSSQQLADCMPGAQLTVRVGLTADQLGYDVFGIRARNLPPNREYTVFLLEQAGAPFGAAEYIGDFSTNPSGEGHNTFHLIVQEAFSST